MLAVVGLAVGTSFLVWPLVNIVVTPKLENLTVKGSVKVDMDVSKSLVDSGVIAGKIIGTGNTVTEVLKGIRTVRLGNAVVTYVGSEADAAVAATAAKAAGDEYVVRQPFGEISWSVPQAALSGRLTTIPFTVQVERYRRFPVADWRSQLKGMSLTEARDWLNKQAGVASALVEIYPSFFANFSGKLPHNDSAIRLSLDISGKTSILE